jgi:hypothetical protein
VGQEAAKAFAERERSQEPGMLDLVSVERDGPCRIWRNAAQKSVPAFWVVEYHPSSID